MPRRRHSHRRAAAWVALLTATLWFAPGAAANEAAVRDPGGEVAGRPDPETIRREAQDVLSGLHVQQAPTFWEWLGGRLADWRIPRWLVSAGRVLGWVLTIVLIILLLAAIAWTVFMLMQSYGRPKRGAPTFRTPHFAAATSYEELLGRMRERAERGAFAEAVALMMLAALKWLDQRELVRFHPSKTNGDYTREFPSATSGGRGFRRFVVDIDVAIYGGATCRRETYGRLLGLFEGVQRDVQTRP